MSSETEFQRTGRNKATQINTGYINGGEYRKKFDTISDAKELNRLVYHLAKKMLIHRAGTEYEDMYWIDLDTLTIVAEELQTDTVKKIVYSEKRKRLLKHIKRHRREGC